VEASLEAAVVFFDFLLFAVDAVLESEFPWAAVESLELAVVFFDFLLFLGVLESVCDWSAGCCWACARAETLPAKSSRPTIRETYRFFMLFIFLYSLRPLRLFDPDGHTGLVSNEAGSGGFQLRSAEVPSRNAA